MRLSREKINKLSKIVLTTLLDDDSVEFFDDDNNIRLEVVEVLTKELELDDKIDESVRNTIGSYSKIIREGTPEWEILYHKHYHEEVKKRRGL